MSNLQKHTAILYFSTVTLWLNSKHIRFVLPWAEFKTPPKVMMLQSAQRQVGSGSPSATNVAFQPHKKSSNGMSYGRRKIQAMSDNLSTWCVMNYRSQSHTLTSWGRLVSICKEYLIFFKGCSLKITPKRLLCLTLK